MKRSTSLPILMTATLTLGCSGFPSDGTRVAPAGLELPSARGRVLTFPDPHEWRSAIEVHADGTVYVLERVDLTLGGERVTVSDGDLEAPASVEVIERGDPGWEQLRREERRLVVASVPAPGADRHAVARWFALEATRMVSRPLDGSNGPGTGPRVPSEGLVVGADRATPFGRIRPILALLGERGIDISMLEIEAQDASTGRVGRLSVAVRRSPELAELEPTWRDSAELSICRGPEPARGPHVSRGDRAVEVADLPTFLGTLDLAAWGGRVSLRADESVTWGTLVRVMDTTLSSPHVSAVLLETSGED